MTEEDRKEWIWYAYRDAMELSKEGMEIEQIEELLMLYEEEELYLHCAGIKEAIDDLKKIAKEEYELAKLIKHKKMKTIKILNLYACLGGNRYKWDEVADIDVTAVEWDEELAKLYQERFPNDTVIVADAHQYLLDHYQEFDFIWSSPPCPTHSTIRITQKTTESFIPKFPDMKLYEEIIFLEHHFKGKYVVENVTPYYTPLIAAKKRGRHLYWTNFNLPNSINERKLGETLCNMTDEIGKLSSFHDYDFRKYKGKQRLDKVARNLVDYQAGKTILETVVGIKRKQDITQTELF